MAKTPNTPNTKPEKISPIGRNPELINRGDRGDSDRVQYGMVVTSIPRFSKRYYLVKQKVL